jgi:GNAT superfamily N-acetyltransferase
MDEGPKNGSSRHRHQGDSVILRRACASDIAAMHRVRVSVRENTLSAPNRITESDYMAALEVLGRTWVVEAEGAVVGFATGFKNGSIWALFIHPAHDGRGYGKALLDVVVTWLWSEGFKQIWLTTAPGTRAERFYESQGWQRSGADPDGDERFELHNDIGDGG